MSNIFKDFYFGELGLREEEPTDEEYVKGRDEYEKAYENLEKTLYKNQKELLNALAWCEAGKTAELEYLSYKEGFRAGLLIGLELSESTFGK